MIHFHSENDFLLQDEKQLTYWIQQSIEKMSKGVGEINYVFCDDNYLLNLNQEYLSHDTLTDIISFDYSESAIISGDIFISTQRVKENSVLFRTSFTEELHRVLIHGLLHFKGFKDKTKSEKTEMRKQEDYYLSLRDF